MSERSKLIPSQADKETFNLVVIGDGAVGKTCMLISYAKNEFPKEYVPTVFDNYVVSVGTPSGPVDLSLKDTAGQEDLASVRRLSYHGAHVFLVCFSVVNPTSFENVDMWVKDIREFDPSIPFVLVGTQTDLRLDKKKQAELAQKGKTPVAYEKGIEKQRAIGAYCYVECSALTRLNLNRVFSDSVSAVLTKKQSQQTEGGCPCTLL
eukprot:TRINITY_DN10368_c0_g1_i1.p1 TRINITY_DN10368_c0_g1~~TRINITY_DN10368_c0_g1_i1.p1  ORF type:complete len:207 (-),score=45.36 TRINITY_DN10368_c0_g1_i1:36-656(-)